MFELAVVAGAGWLLYRRIIKFGQRISDTAIIGRKTTKKVDRLWDRAQQALRDNKFRAAEKALLNILKVDHKNAAAYNRLGTIYAKEKNLDDARECFEIASSLTPTLSSLYNLGLVEYELGNYRAAAHAFERVIDLEPTLQRYLAFAKAHHQLGNMKQVVYALERAVEMEKSVKLLEMLAEAYDATGATELAERTRRRAKRLYTRRERQRPHGRLA